MFVVTKKHKMQNCFLRLNQLTQIAPSTDLENYFLKDMINCAYFIRFRFVYVGIGVLFSVLLWFLFGR